MVRSHPAMTPRRFQRIAEVFDAAADAPEAERAAILARLSGDDTALCAEVEALLAASADASAQIHGAIGREATLVAGEAARAAPRRLGPYRLEREIGRGGMGAVYLAVRDDDEYRTRVAIKLLHLGLETAHAVARFRDERQILATLDHPGIVRLLDGGSTKDRFPYLVMDHVEGVPITQWAQERDLDVRARVELFRKVCAAVAFAHQRLIVHRDIKPSNILVTAGGAPILLDFGIAKLLDPGAGREAETRTGMRLFTPEYASPEQVRGEPVSTSADVYALGAVLYELLSGAQAQRVEGEGLEALQAALETDPPRPSLVAPAARRRAIAGDLDNIVMKALHKEPSQRYASVEQLSEDLERHLDGALVQARAGTWTYRAGKLLTSKRGVVLALGVVLLSLSTAAGHGPTAGIIVAALGGALVSLSTATVVSVRRAQRAVEAARRADEQTKRVQKRFEDLLRLATSMLFDVDGKIQSLEGAIEGRVLIVSRVLEYLDGLASEAGDNGTLAQDLAAAYMKIGDLQGNTLNANLGRPWDGLASYAKARRLLDRLIASGQADATTSWTLARALVGEASLRRALGANGPMPEGTLSTRQIVSRA